MAALGYTIPEEQDHFMVFIYNSKQTGVKYVVHLPNAAPRAARHSHVIILLFRMQKPIITVESDGLAIEYVNHKTALDTVPYLADATARTQNGTDLSLALRFDCIKAGRSVVKVVTRFIREKDQKTIAFSFNKDCKQGLLSLSLLC